MTVPVQGEVLPVATRRLSVQGVKAQRAHEVHEQIVRGVRAIKRQWIELAERLYLFQEQEMWRDLGHESLAAYCADPDVDIEVRDFYAHTAVWKSLVVERHVRPEDMRTLHVSKVRVVEPAIRRGQVTVEEAFADCEVLPRSALELKYSGRASATPGRPDTGTKIEAALEPLYRRCETCNGSGKIEVGEAL